jgi:hypothetical protein
MMPTPMPAPPDPPSSRRSKRVWIIRGAITIVVLIVIGIAAGSGSAATNKVKRERDSLRSKLTGTESQLSAAQARANKLNGDIASLQGQVSTAEHNVRVAQAEAKNAEHQAFRDAKAALATQQAGVSAQAATVRQQQAAVTAAKGELDRTSIGEGTYQIGVDVQPGTYYTSGDGSCYYAILNSTDTNDIATNDLGAGPKLATLNPGKWFETSGCPDWVKR